MTQRSSQDDKFMKTIGIGIVGGLSIIGSGLVSTPATATSSFVVPDTSAPASPTPTIEFTPPAPAQKIKPVPRQNTVRQARPQRTSTATRAPKPAVTNPVISPPKVSVPASDTAGVNNLILQPQAASPGQNSYIDTTNYGGYQAPSSVVLTDRASGFSSISQNGKLTNGVCGTSKRQSINATRPRLSRSSAIASRSNSTRIYQATRRTSVGSTVKPPSTIALAPIPKYNRATTTYYPQLIPKEQRNTSLMFPLPIPAKITSAFGWRIHPVTGSERMHSGTDIGAPAGTPVLAAYPGQVAVADWVGGYGLTVILRHEQNTQESRYAHLSEIFVKPEDWVKQGTVIGRVGSTGMSTGTHLHFEWRYLTSNHGWVAVDAGLHLEYALANLMDAMQMANTETKPQG
jgi:murein DD-endopeptidase MepM/ murein hydrolase activator NlpD